MCLHLYLWLSPPFLWPNERHKQREAMREDNGRCDMNTQYICTNTTIGTLLHGGQYILSLIRWWNTPRIKFCEEVWFSTTLNVISNVNGSNIICNSNNYITLENIQNKNLFISNGTNLLLLPERDKWNLLVCPGLSRIPMGSLESKYKWIQNG